MMKLSTIINTRQNIYHGIEAQKSVSANTTMVREKQAKLPIALQTAMRTQNGPATIMLTLEARHRRDSVWEANVVVHATRCRPP
jgi:hypothetical protein